MDAIDFFFMIIFIIYIVAKLFQRTIKIFRGPVNMSQRYGDKTWAIVTGASSGVGLGFCQELYDK